MNNPLCYTDPSGELFGLDDFAAALIIGALIGGASYTLTALLADVPFSVGGLLKSMAIGAASNLAKGQTSYTFGMGSSSSSQNPGGNVTIMQKSSNGTISQASIPISKFVNPPQARNVSRPK